VRDDEVLGLGLAVALLVTSRKVVDLGPGWVWPVPALSVAGERAVNYAPVISDGLGSHRPGGRIHAGVDVMYRRRSLADRPEYKQGSNSGSEWHFAPRHTPIMAVRDGTVWSVRKTTRGWAVVLGHEKPWATFYTHLETTGLPLHARGVNVATGKPTNVKAGDIIGTMGFDPLDKSKLRHLHMELWRNGSGAGHEVDPAPSMAKWPVVPWALTV